MVEAKVYSYVYVLASDMWDALDEPRRRRIEKTCVRQLLEHAKTAGLSFVAPPKIFHLAETGLMRVVAEGTALP